MPSASLTTSIRAGLVALLLAIAAASSPAAADESASERVVRLQHEIHRELLDRPKVEKARQAFRDARNAFNDARSEVVDRVREKTEYRRLLAEERELKGKLREVYHRYRHGVPPKDVTGDLSHQILEVSTQRSALLHDALERDKDVIEAREELKAAGRTRYEILRWIPWEIRTDPRMRRALRAAGRPVR